MKATALLTSLLLCVLSATLLALGQTKKPLTNDDVVQMVKAGFDEATIVKAIQANETNFDASVDALVALRTAGASKPIIDAMLEAEARKKDTAPSANDPNAQPAMSNSPPEPASKLMLKEGTEVKLKFRDNLSSKTAAEGDPVNLTLDQDLKVGEVTVARAGAAAVGTISQAKKSGMLGRAGELNMRLDHLLAGDSRVKLRGSKGKQGEGKEGTTVALTVLFGPIGLIKHGKNVEIKEGTPLVAYVDQDIELPPLK
ncbi:MAG TPA: hypothetical protein VN776_04955 [Terracidiphilus sp.]|nr:hypothetical protein [Terracidiphilus sp.]